MPFVTISGISQYIGEASAEVLVSTGQGTESTAFEAAQCVSRYIAHDDERAVKANQYFNRTYGNGGRLHIDNIRKQESGRSL